MAHAETVTVPDTAAGVLEALDAVEAFSRRAALPDVVRRRVLTALDEVLSNIVRHAARTGSEPVVIRVVHDAVELVIDVADSFGAFNPLLLPPPDTTSPLEARRGGGLGIALVRGLADEVRYDRREGKNHVTMHWRMARPGGGGSTHADQ